MFCEGAARWCAKVAARIVVTCTERRCLRQYHTMPRAAVLAPLGLAALVLVALLCASSIPATTAMESRFRKKFDVDKLSEVRRAASTMVLAEALDSLRLAA